MMARVYSRKELAEYLEIKPYQVNLLQQKGIINPSRDRDGFYIYDVQCLRDAEDYFLTTPKANSQWQSAKRVAEMFGVSSALIRSLANRGNIKSQKSWIGERLVNIKEVQEVLKNREAVKSMKRIRIIETPEPEDDKPQPVLEKETSEAETVEVPLEQLRKRKTMLAEKLELVKLMVEVRDMEKQLSELEKGLQ